MVDGLRESNLNEFCLLMNCVIVVQCLIDIIIIVSAKYFIFIPGLQDDNDQVAWFPTSRVCPNLSSNTNEAVVLPLAGRFVAGVVVAPPVFA